jgi:HEAT repeat protein
MLTIATVTIIVLVAVVAVIAVGIVTVRLIRTSRHARQAALAGGPRKALLAFVAENGEEGGPELVAVPDDAWRAAEPGAIALLGKLRGEAHAALTGVFLQRGTARQAMRDLGHRSPVRRARAAQVLGDLELRAAVPELCRLLEDRHGEVRIVAVRALGRIGDPSAAWRLIAGLDRPDPAPSLLVTHTLVQLGADAEVTLSAALDHPQARVRVVCLDALGLLGATGAVTRIARVLREDTSLDVRVAAAANLGRLGTRSAVAPLIDALATARPTPLRAAAARALGSLGAPTAMPHLQTLLRDDAFRVAHEGAQALRRLGRTGQEALRQVVAREAAASPVDGAADGTHAEPSTAAVHALEALALVEIAAAATAPAAGPVPSAVPPVLAGVDTASVAVAG